ncbi:MAG TPA: EAL domain-containing protein [Geminicoccaceae bacterium]|nr:EAL domain-containing protein [Geminicoccaceae bacterium]
MDLLPKIPDLVHEAIIVAEVRPHPGAAPRIAYANGALLRLTGLDGGEVLGESLRLLRGAGTDRREFARLLAAVENGEHLRLTLRVDRRHGAGPVWVELAGQPLDAGGRYYLILLQDASDRRRLAIEAEQQARRLQTLAELAADYVYTLRVGPDARLVLDWVAGRFREITGYERAEVEALGGWSALVFPPDLPAVQRRSQWLLAGEAAVAEYRIRTKSGERRWLRDVARPQWDEAGTLVTGVLGAVLDVTEQRDRDERLAALEHDCRALLTLTRSLVCQLDGRGRILACAGDAEGGMAARLRAGVGRPLEQVLGRDPARSWLHHADCLAADGEPIEFRHVDEAAGRREGYQVRLAAGAADTVFVGIQRVPAEGPLALRPAPGAGATLGRSLLNAVGALVVELSMGFEVTTLNAAAERLTGWADDEAHGSSFLDLFVPDDEREQVLTQLERARGGHRVEGHGGRLRVRGGQERRLAWTFAPLYDDWGRVVAVVASASPAVPVRSLDRALLEGQERLNAIVDSVADGIITVDQEGVIQSFSRSAEDIFDYRREEIVGRGIDLLLTRAPRAAEGGDEGGAGAGAGGRLTPVELAREPGELLGRRRSGEVIPIELAVNEVSFNGSTLTILTVRDITLRKQTEETIRNLAYHDPLTSLPNRLLFNDRLTQAIERARRGRVMLCVMLVDLDRFKLINDSLGLASGDEVLRAVAERLVATVRKSDTVARLGGDEFLILLPGTEGAESAAVVAQKVLDSFKPLLPISGQEISITASIGIALYPHDGENAETLIRNADTALYRAKEQGRHTYQFYTTDMNARAFERLVLETQLRKALESAELVLYYQPQVRIDTGEIVGVEALVRWFHGDLGLISPAEFIPLAEETGLILAIGEWVLRTACHQVRQWHAVGFGDLRLAVNLSGRQFQQADFVATVARLLEETGFEPTQLELELTESVIMRDAEETIGKLRQLDELGIHLAIDDFGTGYSSLNYLKRFPIKSLKIDQSFIQDIPEDSNDAAIAQAIIAMAESLRLKVIAEGVETREQLELLRSYRCEEMQGYLFSRPLPAEELLELLREGRRLAL